MTFDKRAALFGASVMSAISALYPIQAVRDGVIVLFACCFLDWITGIMAAILTQTPLSSRKMVRGVYKAFLYACVPALMYFAVKSLFNEGMASIAAGALVGGFMATEILSIFKNIDRSETIRIPEWLKHLIRGKMRELSKTLDEQEKNVNHSSERSV